MTDSVWKDEGDQGAAGSGERDPRPALLTSPMSLAQKIGIAMTLLITAADGFDILAASFAAPGIMAEWKVTHATIGIILAMNLVGMGLGALLISPLADRIGRRRTILPCLLLVSAAMLLSCLTTGPVELAALRLVTGLGIGGMAAPTLSLATEYANLKSRPLAAAVISIGMPLGGMFGGATASWLLQSHDWRAVFIAAGLITLSLGVAATALLPESVDYLMSRGGERNLATLNRVLRRFGQPPLSHLPASAAREAADGGRQGKRSGGPAIFARGLRATTIAMIVINFTQMMTIFYFMSWLPQMVADMKFSGADAAGVSIYQNMFGIVGAVGVGLLGRRLPIVPLALTMMAGTAFAIILFTLLPANLALLKVGAGFEGLMALGCSAAIYGVMARAFPTANRSTGIGIAYAFGRLGSVAAAVVPGVLFTGGWSAVAVALVMSIGSVVAISALLWWRADSGHRLKAAEPVPSPA
ncbi:MFS transporter [Sphingobium jiangsuense]|uniref:MFS family permease n=1 Tax=Sphingobium jiangsuense TaxID=870476 RepID=A0A7W6BJW3_9SPHN|nr:MFS transporter [Sphingobium jiangsuense]MBB3928233.1 MFS family permease [Sphingobium jiangsuense]GLS99391.1 MFS transporter [Sphingobium jiangsuense]